MHTNTIHTNTQRVSHTCASYTQHRLRGFNVLKVFQMIQLLKEPPVFDFVCSNIKYIPKPYRSDEVVMFRFCCCSCCRQILVGRTDCLHWLILGNVTRHLGIQEQNTIRRAIVLDASNVHLIYMYLFYCVKIKFLFGMQMHFSRRQLSMNLQSAPRLYNVIVSIFVFVSTSDQVAVIRFRRKDPFVISETIFSGIFARLSEW